MKIEYYEGFKDISLRDIFEHRKFDEDLIKFLDKHQIKTVKQFLEKVSFEALSAMDIIFNEPYFPFELVPRDGIDKLHNYCKLFLLPKMNYAVADLIFDAKGGYIVTCHGINLCDGVKIPKEEADWFNLCYKNIKLPWLSYCVE